MSIGEEDLKALIRRAVSPYNSSTFCQVLRDLWQSIKYHLRETSREWMPLRLEVSTQTQVLSNQPCEQPRSHLYLISPELTFLTSLMKQILSNNTGFLRLFFSLDRLFSSLDRLFFAHLKYSVYLQAF